MRYFRMLAVVALLLAPASASALPLCSWPSYENTARVWGQVVNIQSSTVNGVLFEAFFVVNWKPSDTTTATSGNWIRVDCGTDAVALGCDQVAIGDSILVSGRLTNQVACGLDGADDYITPGVVWRCTYHIPGSCLQLTPCS